MKVPRHLFSILLYVLRYAVNWFNRRVMCEGCNTSPLRKDHYHNLGHCLNSARDHLWFTMLILWLVAALPHEFRCKAQT